MTDVPLEPAPDPTVDEVPESPVKSFDKKEEQQRILALDMASRVPQTGLTSYLESAQKILTFIQDGTKVD